MSVRVTVRGDFRHMERFGETVRKRSYLRQLSKYGSMGVAALKSATPERSGDTAESWYYEIVDKPGYFAIHWLNSNVEEPGKIPVAILIQYGHGTRNGGFVYGEDFINPAMRRIFDAMAVDMWREVTKP